MQDSCAKGCVFMSIRRDLSMLNNVSAMERRQPVAPLIWITGVCTFILKMEPFYITVTP